MKVVNNTNNDTQMTVQEASSVCGTCLNAYTSQTYNAADLPPDHTTISLAPAAVINGIHGWYYRRRQRPVRDVLDHDRVTTRARAGEG